MKNNMRDSLNELSEIDIYSMILFSLYKIKEIPEYSTLSELVYILDKNSLFNFLECYGGMTIRVPTVDEFKIVINALLLYQYTQIEGNTLEEAKKNIALTTAQMNDVEMTYYKLLELLNKYDFKRS